jgi:hypothetical protein
MLALATCPRDKLEVDYAYEKRIADHADPAH